MHHRPCEPDNRPLPGETKLIAAETGYCVKTVSRAIDWWVAHGFLIEDIGLAKSRAYRPQWDLFELHWIAIAEDIEARKQAWRVNATDPPMDILDRGYGRLPQHLTGEDAPVYVARLPEPCKMAEEWEALVKARWSLPSDQASSKPEAQIEGCRGARVYSWKPKKPWATRDSSMAVYVGSGLGSDGQ